MHNIETRTYSNFSDFVHTNCHQIFRYWIYRRGFTPYEQDSKFSDESMYEDVFCKTAYIRECIDLPDGDVLIGFLDADGDSYSHDNIQYCKLSEIRLEWYERDQKCEDNESENDY